MLLHRLHGDGIPDRCGHRDRSAALRSHRIGRAPRLLDRHSLLQPRHRHNAKVVAVRGIVVEAVGDPQVRHAFKVVLGRKIQPEPRRQNPHHHRLRSASRVPQRVPDNTRIATVPASEVLVAQDRHLRQLRRRCRSCLPRLPRLRLRRLRDAVTLVEVAAVQNFRAHQLEEIRRHLREHDLLRRPVGPLREDREGENPSHIRELPPRAVLQIDVIGVGKRQSVDVALAQIHTRHHQLPRILVGQWPQQHCIRHAEDRRARPHSQRDGHHRNDRECRILPEDAACEQHGLQHDHPIPGARGHRTNLPEIFSQSLEDGDKENCGPTC